MRRNIFSILLIVLITIFYLATNNNLAFAKQELEQNGASEFLVCIDPGHQKKADFKGEPVAPGSGNLKSRVSAGTAGVGSKKAEYIVNLEASMILKEMLLQKGYNVILTREDHDVNISNAERAEFANNAKADMTIRVHCDSITDGGKQGASILVPAKSGKYTSAIYEESNTFAEILKENLKAAGVKVNGIHERNDITGFNWSKVPVVILEMGFMSNYEEDKMLNDPLYQAKLMECVTKSVDDYKNIRDNSGSSLN